MEVQKQVCPLEIAKKLQELGVMRPAQLVYVDSKLGMIADNVGWDNTTPGNYYCFEDDKIHSLALTSELLNAYTSSELGEMLPKEYIPEKHLVSAGLRWEFPLCKGAWISCETEAEARARVLIHLLANKLITAEEINKEAK